MPSRRRDLARDGMSPWSRSGPHAPAPHAPAPDPPAGHSGRAAVLAYLAVLACVGAGVWIAWQLGSRGGAGGVVAGAALLAAAVIRLVLPRRLAGLLAVRNRATDVVTLAVLGVGLFTAGLVLPGLRAAIRMPEPTARR